MTRLYIYRLAHLAREDQTVYFDEPDFIALYYIIIIIIYKAIIYKAIINKAI